MTKGSIGLSPRQSETLILVSEGCTDAEIARRMFVEITTVRTHLTEIKEKLGARNRAHAVSIGYQKGILK